MSNQKFSTKNITNGEIEKMDYSAIVSIVKERNRPSGGIKTIHEVAVNSFLNSSKKILEIGSNTGFTSVNMCLLTGCRVTGIDINPDSVSEASGYAKINGVQDRVDFKVSTALEIPFDDETFDMIWVSNVTSFIGEKKKAVNEYLRVLKDGGIIAVVPIYYTKKAPLKIINDVSNVIGSKVGVMSKKNWIELFKKGSNQCSLELFYESDFKYINIKKNDVERFVQMIMNKKHLKVLGLSARDKLYKKYLKIMLLFNKNLRYCGYSILLFQKRKAEEEQELFLSIKK